MPQDRARKQAARAAKDHTSRAYMDAQRQLEEQAPKLREAPAAEVPTPVAVEMARQLHAAWLHLGAFNRLTEDYRITPARKAMEEPRDPVGRAERQLMNLLFELQEWAGRTAHVSGAVSAEPKFMAHSGTPEAEAFGQLYPRGKGSGGWCREPGGTMPQPGEGDHQDGESEHPVHTHLVGPVPDELFSVYGYQGNPAGPAVRGTPAAAVWDARSQLNGYLCQHWEQGGDTPADLAATVEGLSHAASELGDACSMALGELDRRAEEGWLVVRDPAEYTEAVAAARAELEHYSAWPLARVRRALSGARARLPERQRHELAPAVRSFLAKLDGKPLAHVRRKLGDERHLNKQISKTRPANESRAGALQNAVAWMHATNATVYDSGAHLGDVNAR